MSEMSDQQRPLLVVDAANVIGSRPDGWWRDRPAAVRRLLAAMAASPYQDADVLVVVEGAARTGAPPGDHDGIEVVHAPGTADDEIVRIVAAAEVPVTVVTADRGLRDRVTAHGAEILGPRRFLERVSPSS